MELSAKLTGLLAGSAPSTSTIRAGAKVLTSLPPAVTSTREEKHGTENPEGQHASDMPKVTVAANGSGALKTGIKGVTLARTGENSVFHAGGAPVMVG